MCVGPEIAAAVMAITSAAGATSAGVGAIKGVESLAGGGGKNTLQGVGPAPQVQPQPDPYTEYVKGIMPQNQQGTPPFNPNAPKW